MIFNLFKLNGNNKWQLVTAFALFGVTLGLVLITPALKNMIISDPSYLGKLDHSSQVNNAREINNLDLSKSKFSLGTNLNPVADYSTELPFLNAFKSSRKWMTQAKGSWNTNEYEKLDLDERGWVKSLPSPEDSAEYAYVGTLLRREIGGHYPGGKYVVIYDGKGDLEYGFDANKNGAQSTPGRDVIEVTPSNAGIHLKITSTDPNQTGNYIRNIRVVPAEYEKTYQSQIFNPKFIDKIKKFKALRFMDWMGTNDSKQSKWANRPKIEQASYAYGGGVPIELMVELANRLEVDPWFTMPHKATDKYLTNFAQLVKDSLDPNLTIHLEYSNEVWNAQFEQFSWVKDNGPVSGGKTPYQPYGVRAAQMCDIWKGVFGEESNRVKCIMGTQTANSWVAKQVLNCERWEESPCYKHGIDALTITGYFSGKLGKPRYESTIESWIDNPNIDEFEKALTQLEDGSVLDTEGDNTEDMVNYFNEYSKMAKDKGLELVAYEAGSHVVGNGKVIHNEKITEFFVELHTQPEFYDRYMEMLEAWKDSQGRRGLFMHFTDITKHSKWGSWGALEYVDQDSSPRYDALIDFIDRNFPA